MTSKSNSAESTEEIHKKKNTEKYSINHEHCWRNCLNRFGSIAAQKFNQEVKPTSTSQKGPSEQTGPSTENDYKWTVHCREGKPCPTISLLVDKKKLEQIAKLTIESTLNQNLSELLNGQKQNYSESRQENSSKPFQNTEIPTTETAVAPSQEREPSEDKFSNNMNPGSQQREPSEDKFSNNMNPGSKPNLYKENSDSNNVPVPILNQKGTKKSELSIQKSVYLSKTCISHTYNSNGNEKTELNSLKLSKSDSRSPSVEIKSTNLSKTPSYEEDENELDKWKRNCNEGVFALQSLVDKCEKDPNSVLATFKERLGTDRKLPNGSFETVDEPDQLFILEKTHGRIPGDPKYHLLMIDRSTSFHKSDCTFTPMEIEPLEKISEHSTLSEEEEINEEIIKPETYQTYDESKLQQISIETIPEVIQLQQSLLSQKAQQLMDLQKLEEIRQLQQPTPEQSVQSPPSEQQSSPQSEQESPPQSPQQSKEQKLVLPPREKKASILFKETTSIIDDEEEKKRSNTKRVSAVSWRSLNPPSDSDSTASLEQVVKDATAKAETFRQHLDAKRQHSLLDIVKRKSTLDKQVEETKPPAPPPPTPPPPKRKKFFNFKCFEKKKQPQKEKEEIQSDSDEESVEEQEQKQTRSSSLYLDNYRRRNTSVIDNPVFEKKKELNQFLNNI